MSCSRFIAIAASCTRGSSPPSIIAAMRWSARGARPAWADRSVFRFISRLALGEGRPRLVNAICAFAYAPGTWQAQHLVSLQRREYTGTLALLLALSVGPRQWHRVGTLLRCRPNNPGTNALFGGIAERLPKRPSVTVARRLRVHQPARHGFLGRRDCLVAVRSLGSDEGALAAAFYERVLDPVELDSLRLAQPGLHELDAAYALHGLTRRGTVSVARDGDRVVGACAGQPQLRGDQLLVPSRTQ